MNSLIGFWKWVVNYILSPTFDSLGRAMDRLYQAQGRYEDSYDPGRYPRTFSLTYECPYWVFRVLRRIIKAIAWPKDQMPF